MMMAMVVAMVVSPVVVVMVMAALCYGLSDHDPSCHAQSCSDARSSLEHTVTTGDSYVRHTSISPHSCTTMILCSYSSLTLGLSLTTTFSSTTTVGCLLDSCTTTVVPGAGWQQKICCSQLKNI